ncbi:YigZ family protein [Persicimonas caeni]|uniref:YigZ family protein n=1 Tax=Persicimonas caeni TaxID=2292766 RepID=A0A4Y6PZ50_PERCE|nr:YigZ family protein [Persicimonas caeni]QDG53520.1 YigZ family protein [Persicimonas caeni]QED34741.1 YigZ family protein [Persicimonas caeni]
MSNDTNQNENPEPYKVVAGFGEAEYVVERSRFIGRALPVESEDEALAYVDEVKEEHYDARHVCYGFRIGRGSQTIDRCNDDGEPARTAGLPIWQILEGREITDTLVVVIRYFGGIKLGMGGLARAYREAARQALDEAGVEQRFPSVDVSLSVPYAMHGKVEHLLDQFEGVRERDTDFTADVTLHLSIYRRDLGKVTKRLAALLQCEPGEVFDQS